VDTRSLEEFTGAVQKDGAARPGHIPGSIHADYIYTLRYDSDYQFHAIDTLRQYFMDKGITPDKQIITYCHSGVRSALTLFVLRELLHYPHVQNYDGSWVEWSYFPELPAIVDSSSIDQL
jgi:thiosulfate/3-mercaptopyruvate sulfurtransferase